MGGGEVGAHLVLVVLGERHVVGLARLDEELRVLVVLHLAHLVRVRVRVIALALALTLTSASCSPR